MDLFSECKCGRRYHILVHAPAFSFGFGFKATATVSSVSFDDGEACPDPTAFLGAYLSASAGATLGVNPLQKVPMPGYGRPGVGANIGVSRYGNVTSSISSPVSATVGVERSIVGSTGLTFMNVIEVKQCCERK